VPLQNLITNSSTRFDNWTTGRSKQKNSWQDLTISILLVLKSGPEGKKLIMLGLESENIFPQRF